MIHITFDQDRRAWKIYFQKSLWKEVPNTLFRWKPKLPDCSTKGELEAVWEACEKKRAKQYVVRALSKKNYSTWQMEKRLVERGISHSTAKATVLACQEAGYIDDKLWLEQALFSMVRKGYGPRKIIQELIVKGVSIKRAKAAVEENVDASQAKETLEKLFAKKFQNANMDDPKQRRKVIGALMRKGFSYQMIEDLGVL